LVQCVTGVVKIRLSRRRRTACSYSQSATLCGVGLTSASGNQVRQRPDDIWRPLDAGPEGSGVANIWRERRARN